MIIKNSTKKGGGRNYHNFMALYFGIRVSLGQLGTRYSGITEKFRGYVLKLPFDLYFRKRYRSIFNF